MDRSDDDNSGGASDPPTVRTGPPLVAAPPLVIGAPVAPIAATVAVLSTDAPWPLIRRTIGPPPRPMSPRHYPALNQPVIERAPDFRPAPAAVAPELDAAAAFDLHSVDAPPRAPLLVTTLPPLRRDIAPPVLVPVLAPQITLAATRHAEPARRTETQFTPEKAAFLARIKPLALKAGRFAATAGAAWLALILVLIVAYRFVNPPMSSLMLQKRVTGNAVTQAWVPIDSISPQVVRAVLLSEDGRFCQHWGVDFAAMQDAIERAGDGIPRGASTISMQVTKNLFLWPSKSYIRKAIEIPLTWAIEMVWPKRRIMEVYLNIAEWGPGIFGVEAASRAHFDKAASRLNEREAAQLAVALPNPHARDPGDPGPQTRRLAGDIQSRMRSAYPSQTACVLGTRRTVARAE